VLLLSVSSYTNNGATPLLLRRTTVRLGVEVTAGYGCQTASATDVVCSIVTKYVPFYYNPATNCHYAPNNRRGGRRACRGDRRPRGPCPCRSPNFQSKSCFPRRESRGARRGRRPIREYQYTTVAIVAASDACFCGFVKVFHL